MATHILPVNPTSVDTSRYERLDGQLAERPLPNDIHSDTASASGAETRHREKEMLIAGAVQISLEAIFSFED